MRRDNQEGGADACVDQGIEFCVALVRYRELRRRLYVVPPPRTSRGIGQQDVILVLLSVGGHVGIGMAGSMV